MEHSLYGMGLLFVTGIQQIPAGSPYPDYDHIACGVFSGGNVYWCDNVTFSSYGNHFSFSPDLVYYSDYVYCIDKRGAVYDNDQYVAETSYGIFFQK